MTGERTQPMRIAVVGAVAQSIPPTRSGSVEGVTALLTDGLVAKGHEVTLFATGSSSTTARLHATFPLGYHEDTSLWPWELCALLHLAAAIARARTLLLDATWRREDLCIAILNRFFSDFKSLF